MIYLDACATTRTDPRVLDAMLPHFSDAFGNPGSRHDAGRRALHALERARIQVADALGARPKEIIFTSGATEAINLFLRGLHHPPKPCHLISAATEHKATLATLEALERAGADVTTLPVGPRGLVDPESLRRALRPDTRAVCVMWVNNETGVLQPLQDLLSITHDHGALFFCDATQALGKVPVDVLDTPVDALAISAHKFHGPQGTGALYLPRRTARALHPVFTGGDQERGWRPGTPATPLIVGLGHAASLLSEPCDLTPHRDALLTGLLHNIPGAYLHGAEAPRAPHCINMCLPGARAESLVLRLSHQVAVSTGSACNAQNPEPSHVLLAMGVPPHDAHASLRISVDRFTTQEDTKSAINLITRAHEALRNI